MEAPRAAGVVLRGPCFSRCALREENPPGPSGSWSDGAPSIRAALASRGLPRYEGNAVSRIRKCGRHNNLDSQDRAGVVCKTFHIPGSASRSDAESAFGVTRSSRPADLEVPMEILRHPLSCLSVALVLVIIAASGAGAATCGGAVVCQCGDRVTANRTLVCGVDPVTTTVCTGDGLGVGADVTLSRGGCTIAGDSKDDADVGIVVAGDNATVKNGKVTNFGFGVSTVPGSPTTGSTLASLDVFENGEGIRFLTIGS